jgi:hypothetical protein
MKGSKQGRREAALTRRIQDFNKYITISNKTKARIVYSDIEGICKNLKKEIPESVKSQAKKIEKETND